MGWTMSFFFLLFCLSSDFSFLVLFFADGFFWLNCSLLFLRVFVSCVDAVLGNLVEERRERGKIVLPFVGWN